MSGNKNTRAVILGVDPGLHHTGWGLISAQGNHISHIASGRVTTQAADPLVMRLEWLHRELSGVIERYRPDVAAMEETYINSNARTSLMLGQARGAILLTLGLNRLTVHSYATRLIKKAVTGSGRADKEQIVRMLQLLLPQAMPGSHDAADALAAAMCHAQHQHVGVVTD